MLKLYSFDFGWMGSCVVAADTPEEALETVNRERPDQKPCKDTPYEITIQRGIIHDDWGDQ